MPILDGFTRSAHITDGFGLPLLQGGDDTGDYDRDEYEVILSKDEFMSVLNVRVA